MIQHPRIGIRPTIDGRLVKVYANQLKYKQ